MTFAMVHNNGFNTSSGSTIVSQHVDIVALLLLCYCVATNQDHSLTTETFLIIILLHAL